MFHGATLFNSPRSASICCHCRALHNNRLRFFSKLHYSLQLIVSSRLISCHRFFRRSFCCAQNSREMSRKNKPIMFAMPIIFSLFVLGAFRNIKASQTHNQTRSIVDWIAALRQLIEIQPERSSIQANLNVTRNSSSSPNCVNQKCDNDAATNLQQFIAKSFTLNLASYSVPNRCYVVGFRLFLFCFFVEWANLQNAFSSLPRFLCVIFWVVGNYPHNGWKFFCVIFAFVAILSGLIYETG